MSALLIPEAMARMEGYGKPGTRPTRNNNPGDIEWGKFAVAHGADRQEVGAFGRFAHFPTEEQGFAAMRSLLRIPATFKKNPDGSVFRDKRGNRFIVGGYAGSTIVETLNHYAPPAENDVSAYLSGVLQLTGLTADTIIDGHIG